MNPIGTLIALAGNPNSGKTTLFNRLTGLRQRVGNYPGVTVEKKWGRFRLGDQELALVDLPGTYSLVSRSKDEAIAFEVLSGKSAGLSPALTLLVLDASNLERNLYLALQVLELGHPAVIALNMIDVARSRGLEIDVAALSAQLGVPVVPIAAASGEGLAELERTLAGALKNRVDPKPRPWQLDERTEAVFRGLADELATNGSANKPLSAREGEAIWLLASAALSKDEPANGPQHPDPKIQRSIEHKLAGLEGDWLSQLIEARYRVIAAITKGGVRRKQTEERSFTDRLDALLLHRVFGPVIFLVVMALVFQSIFSWADPLIDGIETVFAALGGGLESLLPAGALRSLLIEGVIGGVGAVLVFIPQIAILFFFLALLEDFGYLARAAYLMDRLMSKVGLHGRAFVPLLSGFACAIPAIMATRTIESPKDRLVTILVTPLMSCSARLPVYALIIGTLFSGEKQIFGILSAGAVLLLALYLLSVSAAVLAAFVLKRTLIKSPTPPLVLELPPYRRPRLGDVLGRVYERCSVFVREAGTVILACTIVLWGLLSYPRHPEFAAARAETSAADEARIQQLQLEQSYAGRLGRGIEPLIAPLGFDWKIGIGLVGSFAAREVLVSTLGLVYGIGKDADEESGSLRKAMRDEVDPRTGKKVYTPLVGLSLMVFFLLACQCLSTLAVVRRETASWRWPAFLFAYMTVLAWVASFVVYQGGRLLGFT